MKTKFIKILKEFGFNRLKQYREDVYPYNKGTDPYNSQYAEIINYSGSFAVWMPTGETYWGRHFYDVEKLRDYLTELLTKSPKI